MKGRPEEIKAALAWLRNENPTGRDAQQALRNMGFTPASGDRAVDHIDRAGYWARRLTTRAEG